jgi:shikimate kinase
MSRPIVLLGLMGCGKTTVGRLLARRLARKYWDNDDGLRELTGRTAAELALESGPDVLHGLELEALMRGVGRRPAEVVGGAAAVVLDPRLPTVLAGAWVVWLRADITVLAARLRSGDGHRPFLGGDLLATLREMARLREPLYAQIAHLTVDVGRIDAAEAVRRIAAQIPEDV